ncbi:MAG: peptidase M49 [Vicinamibacterales bacterium]
MTRRYLLEQVDDAAVVQYYADGFVALPVEQKILAWHLYQAALAGRDIYYDQRYRHSLEMRELLEQVLTTCPTDTAEVAAIVAEVRRYTKLFWINSGPHNTLTARKFVLRCSPADLALVVDRAAAHGGRFPLRDDESIASLLSRLRGAFFDPDVDPLVTSKTPEGGVDILRASANNFYSGVSMSDMETFDERHGLNARLVNDGGTLVEQVYRASGIYGEHITRIVRHLRSALAYASPRLPKSLEALIRFYESGEDEDRVAYDIAWVEDDTSPVDTINGFVENYLDARGVKGAWEGMVFYVNEAKTAGLTRLAHDAPWFEARMPWDARWRRREVIGVTARAIDVIVETGDAGPVTPIGINLPNDQQIRERYGSRSVSLANIAEAYEHALPTAFRREFCWSDEESGRAERWAALALEVTTAIHEVLGHGSGLVADHLEGQPQLVLKEQYSSLEEARADLVGLYFVSEPRLAEIGLLPAEHQPEIVVAAYEAYARNALVQLRRVRQGTTLEEDHMRNRQMVVHWLRAHTSAIDARQRDGQSFYVVVDVDEFREGVGRLLADVQRIKSEGDYRAAKDLFDLYGTYFDAGLRDEIVGRVDRLNLPSYTGFVQPRLTPRVDASGHIVDVEISYPQDLEQQMLEYSGKLPQAAAL